MSKTEIERDTNNYLDENSGDGEEKRFLEKQRNCVFAKIEEKRRDFP